MVEIVLDRRNKGLGEKEEASLISGNRLVIDNSPDIEAGTGMWNIEALVISRPNQSPKVVRYKITPAVDQEEQDNLRSEWVGNKDPETQTDLVDNEDKQVQELIYLFRKFRSIPYCKRLADRLLTLFAYAKEEDPFNIGIAAGSLRNFYIFLQLHTNIKYPSISLTPDNNIYASWRGENNRVFSILFLPNGGDARFVVLKPNDRYPKQQIAISGAVTTDIIIETAKPYGVLDWISE
ncbi:MAG: hypothetical protein ACUZ8N_14560 [Candidatus Scalindua sp.]